MTKPSQWMSRVAIAPALIWLGLAMCSEAPPPWEATYYPNKQFSGQSELRSQREVMRYWDRSHKDVPGGFSFRNFSARYRGCVRLRESARVVFVVAVRGRAELIVDGQSRASVDGKRKRGVRGVELLLEEGSHLVELRFVPYSWPVVGLSASLDGEAPTALAAPAVIRPASGVSPCPG